MAEFLRVFRVQGMDSNADPRYQMVPKGQCRWIALRDGAGMTIACDDPTVCSVRETTVGHLPADDRAAGATPADRYFVLEGKRKGATFITATRGLTVVALEVAVKERIRQLIMFNYLVDSARRRSTRPAADIGRWMPQLNYIWIRQANVEFMNHGVREAPIASDFGPTIMIPGGNIGATGTAIAGVGLAGVDINVFFVPDLQDSTDPGGDLDAWTTIGTVNSPPGVCFFEDHAGAGEFLSFAHEMGHHMGLDHPDHRQIDLMWPTTGQRGLNLNRDDVETANP